MYRVRMQKAYIAVVHGLTKSAPWKGFFLQTLVKRDHLLNVSVQSSKNQCLKSQWTEEEKNWFLPWDRLHLFSGRMITASLPPMTS